jgi:hypothetical protein
MVKSASSSSKSLLEIQLRFFRVLMGERGKSKEETNKEAVQNKEERQPNHPHNSKVRYITANIASYFLMYLTF